MDVINFHKMGIRGALLNTLLILFLESHAAFSARILLSTISSRRITTSMNFQLLSFQANVAFFAHDLGWLQQIVSWMPQLFVTSSPYIISQISCPYTSLHDDSTYQQSATHRNQTVPINFVPITLEIPLSYDDIGCKCSLMKTTMGQC